MEPPLILVCIDYSCVFLPHFRNATKFAVNVLSESQQNISVAFAERPEGRFDGVDWYISESGVPLLRDCLATLECRVTAIIEAGDHGIFLGEVLSAASHDGQPLVYFNRDYRSLR
jgi:flavin reductase (DIM6/NTAB) family NADH-FMN oxidoreductase RutF